MKSQFSFLNAKKLTAIATLCIAIACSSPKKDTSAEDNIKKFTHVWDEILNKKNLNMFSDSNYTKTITLHASPNAVVGIDNAKAFYANYLTGFSDIEFIIKEAIGMDERLSVYWNFKGTHTGLFFGIPATGKKVDIEGITLVRMENGKVAEERDFFDNFEFMQQLGLTPK